MSSSQCAKTLKTVFSFTAIKIAMYLRLHVMYEISKLNNRQYIHLNNIHRHNTTYFDTDGRCIKTNELKVKNIQSPT